jgi:hypothetical protein
MKDEMGETCSMHGEKGNAHILARKPEEKRPPER